VWFTPVRLHFGGAAAERGDGTWEQAAETQAGGQPRAGGWRAVTTLDPGVTRYKYDPGLGAVSYSTWAALLSEPLILHLTGLLKYQRWNLSTSMFPSLLGSPFFNMQLRTMRTAFQDNRKFCSLTQPSQAL
jgi:hypothetical protein